MKDVTVMIKGKNEYNAPGDMSSDEIEIVTEGKLYEKNNSIYIVYEESEALGINDCKTTVKIDGDKVKMKRYIKDGMPTEMNFQEGKRHTSKYFTPYGPLNMEILTYRLDNTIDVSGKGRLKLDYDISLNGSMEGRNQIDIILK